MSEAWQFFRDSVLPYVGWLATACFTLSFFLKTRMGLMRCQMFAASLWFTYGVLLHDAPIMTANVLVFLASLINQIRLQRELSSEGGANQEGRAKPEGEGRTNPGGRANPGGRPTNRDGSPEAKSCA